MLYRKRAVYLKTKTSKKIRVLLSQWCNTLTRECEELQYEKQLVAEDFLEIEQLDESENSKNVKYILNKAANDLNFKIRRTDFQLV